MALTWVQKFLFFKIHEFFPDFSWNLHRFCVDFTMRQEGCFIIHCFSNVDAEVVDQRARFNGPKRMKRVGYKEAFITQGLALSNLKLHN